MRLDEETYLLADISSANRDIWLGEITRRWSGYPVDARIEGLPSKLSFTEAQA